VGPLLSPTAAFRPVQPSPSPLCGRGHLESPGKHYLPTRSLPQRGG
jgi:hypothetical protein